MATFDGNEMINAEDFDKEWQHFKETFATSDKDMLHGYMILKAMCAILEQAFGIDPVEVALQPEEDADELA